MKLEEIIQSEIEKTIDAYIDEHKDIMHPDAEFEILMLKANLYIAINEKFSQIRKQLENIK